MEPISITIITYVALKFIDQFIKEEGYGRIKKFLFPTEKYKNRLSKLIYETINDFEAEKSRKKTFNKFPFYHSQIFFDELNKFILFKNSDFDYDSIIKVITTNSNIIIPTIDELNSFYKIFADKILNDKNLKKLFVEENYKSKIYELDTHLNRIEGKINKITDDISTLLSETTFQPNNDWLTEQCKSSIDDLGKRYTASLNLNLEISQIFEGIGRTEDFKRKSIKLFDQFLIKGKKILKNQPEVQESLESLKNEFDELQNLLYKIDFLGTASIPVNELDNLLNKAQGSVKRIYEFYITEESKIQREKNDYQYYHKHGSELRNIREFEHELSSFQSLIHDTSFKLANNPFLLLDGEAGIGKSHLIGDIVSRRIDKGYESVFLLGQHFVTEEDPWTQIFKRLQINSKSKDFLTKLNQRAEESGKRIILFIDAINEGKGNLFWSQFVKSFINDIKKYEWLGLVLTIRSSYKNLIFPEAEIPNIDLVQHHHYGFRNIEYEASKLFFDNYKIELPNVPLLHPEFQNPLFLKLFCEGINKAGLTRIPNGLQGITSIINFFIKNVNIVLSKPNRIGYSDGLNLVQKSINALMKCKVENQLRYIPYELAHSVVNDSISNFIDKKGFLDELVTEGLLSKNRFWKDGDDHEEGVYLAYERFEDHLTVQYLLQNTADVEKEFKEGGKLYKYVENDDAIYIYKGLIEAFAIQLPEKNGNEFYNIIPSQLLKSYPIIESFVQSLIWRKIDTITENSKGYIREFVFYYEGTNDLFWETIIAVTGIPDHYYNANFLHSYLTKFSLAERDANWTQFLKYKYNYDSSVRRLVDWAWNQTDKSHIADESILLSAITLSWFLTSTNRKLRDCATKALISLLQNRLTVLQKLLKLFEGVNDPYVYERLFAVTYGCVLRTNEIEKISGVCEYIYKCVFSGSASFNPHILLRDYARGAIEYANKLGIQLSFDLTLIRPPYNSNWPEEIPSQDELEEKYNNDNYRHIWSSVMSFGDFARYTIGTNSGYSKWSGCKKNENPIDRKRLLKNFIDKLNPEQYELYNSLDPIITEKSDDVIFEDSIFDHNIAIGRKSEDDLEVIRANFKNTISSELLIEYETDIEPFLDHNHKIIDTSEFFDLRIAQRLILSKVIELGWNPDLHLSFDQEIGSGRGRSTEPHERIGKKYQWIAYYEYMALLSDNFIKKERWQGEKAETYEGPWDPYVRDIDPTILIKETGSYDDEEPEDFWWTKNNIFDWNSTNENWIEDSNSLPNMKDMILINDENGDEWLILEAYLSWSEPKKIGEEKWDQPHKEFWCNIRSYLVHDNEFDLFKNWAVEQNFMEGWMPESSDRYEMFNREFYWSPADEYFMNKYYEGTEWIIIDDEKSKGFEVSIVLTAQGYLWEEEFDNSKEKTLSFLKPCSIIYNGMNLMNSQRDGEFIDNANVVQCFATNVYNDSPPYLLVRKNSFMSFLHNNNLKIVWTVLGEKQIIGGRSYGNNFSKRLEASGAFYFDNADFAGKLNTKVN